MECELPYFIKRQYSHHTPPEEQTLSTAYMFCLFPGPQSALVQCHNTIQREIAVTLASPI